MEKNLEIFKLVRVDFNDNCPTFVVKLKIMKMFSNVNLSG